MVLHSTTDNVVDRTFILYILSNHHHDIRLVAHLFVWLSDHSSFIHDMNYDELYYIIFDNLIFVYSSLPGVV